MERRWSNYAVHDGYGAASWWTVRRIWICIIATRPLLYANEVHLMQCCGLTKVKLKSGSSDQIWNKIVLLHCLFFAWSDCEELLSIYETVSWFLWWLQISCNSKRDPQRTDCCFYEVTMNSCDQVWIPTNSDETIFYLFFLNSVVLCNDNNVIIFSAYGC